MELIDREEVLKIIEFEEKWLSQTRMSIRDIDIAFDAMKSKIKQIEGWDDGAKATYEHLKMCEEEQSGDLISRDAVWDVMQELWGTSGELIDRLMALPSVNPQESKTGYCKECKYFEYDSVAKVDRIPLIVAHEICKRWGDGCKTKEDGYCFLYEPQESEDKG